MTILSSGENMIIHAAEVGQDGDLGVVANTGPSNTGVFGDLLLTGLADDSDVGPGIHDPVHQLTGGADDSGLLHERSPIGGVPELYD